jgi:hypothetical protein
MIKNKIKNCPKCSAEKDIKYFGVRKSNGGPRSYCKECEKECHKKRKRKKAFLRIHTRKFSEKKEY